MDKQGEKKIINEKHISLAGVNFKKLLSALLKAKPEKKEKQVEKRENKKPNK